MHMLAGDTCAYVGWGHVCICWLGTRVHMLAGDTCAYVRCKYCGVCADVWVVVTLVRST